eukprot:g6745.t1
MLLHYEFGRVEKFCSSFCLAASKGQVDTASSTHQLPESKHARARSLCSQWTPRVQKGYNITTLPNNARNLGKEVVKDEERPLPHSGDTH